MSLFDRFRKRRHEPTAPPQPAAPAPVLARFDGSCQRCGEPIEVGAPIERGDRGDGEVRWLHAGCASPAAATHRIEFDGRKATVRRLPPGHGPI